MGVKLFTVFPSFLSNVCRICYWYPLFHFCYLATCVFFFPFSVLPEVYQYYWFFSRNQFSVSLVSLFFKTILRIVYIYLKYYCYTILWRFHKNNMWFQCSPTLSSPNTPPLLQSLSVSIVRWYRVITSLLCAVQYAGIFLLALHQREYSLGGKRCVRDTWVNWYKTYSGVGTGC